MLWPSSRPCPSRFRTASRWPPEKSWSHAASQTARGSGGHPSWKPFLRRQTSATTTGTPMRWLDTPESWDWMIGNWVRVYQAAGVGARDRIFFAFSFGPFLGFWVGFEAATRVGCLAIPGGGMRSAARLQAIIENSATVLCCTPTYAIRLAEVAAEENIDL